MFAFTSSVPLHRSSPQRHFLTQRRSSVPFSPHFSTRRCKPVALTMSTPLTVMVNGIPGKMATATAEQVVNRGLTLAEEALTGPDIATPAHTISDKPVKLIPPSDHADSLHRMRSKHPRLIIVDYTHPSAANPNVQLYTSLGLSFVLGTTGGDVDLMKSAIESTEDVYAVIAPNMGKQIVAFQAMMKIMAEQFPNAFQGYTLTVKESHQSTKADTSGTAKAVVNSFNKLGLDFGVEQIEKVRDKDRSISEMHVPAPHVDAGHAFHTYRLTSPDGTTTFEFQHNVCGRGIYAAGTVDAVMFLDEQKQAANTQRVFNMVDILRSGAMV